MCRGFNLSVLYVYFTSSIYSNVGHVGQSTVSSNIILKGDQTARFAFIWLNDFIGYLSMYFCKNKTKVSYSVKKKSHSYTIHPEYIGLWCLTPLSTIVQLYRSCQF